MKKHVCSICGKGFMLEEGKKEQDCPICKDRLIDIEYKFMEQKTWDKKTPLCLFRGFEVYSPEEVIELATSVKENFRIKENRPLRWVICEKSKINVPSFDIYGFLSSWYEVNNLPAGWDIPDGYEIEEEINDILEKVKRVTWIPGKYRTEVIL